MKTKKQKIRFGAILALCVIAVLAITSCQKETRTEWQSNKHLKIQSSNPLEFMGVSHNKSLDYVAEASGFPDLTTWELYSEGCGYEDEYFDATTPSQAEYNDIQSEIPDLIEAEKDAPDLCYQEGLIDELTKHRLDTLYDIMYEGYESHEIVTPEDMDDLIYSYEETFIDESKSAEYYLDEHNTDGIILATCVIARYSYHYWYEAVYDENPWTSYIEENGGLTVESFWRKLWADICGFFSNCGEPHDINCNTPDTLPFHHWAWDPVCAWRQAAAASRRVSSGE